MMGQHSTGRLTSCGDTLRVTNKDALRVAVQKKGDTLRVTNVNKHTGDGMVAYFRVFMVTPTLITPMCTYM